MKIGDGFKFMFGVMLFFLAVVGGTCAACGACTAGSLYAIGASLDAGARVDAGATPSKTRR